ncbi:MAG TPA: STAS domain-containing protein [Eubacteriaceae bacterium]|jgi:anti-sigma B factor antagonist|nr:STAS domain-containing protein [Eubacteriaceae bacterium]
MILNIKDQFDEEKGRWLIELEGEADVYTVNNFKERMHQLLDEKMADVEIDGTSLQYIDSIGLGALIGLRGRMADQEKVLIIKNIQPNVRKLLNITGLDKIFIIEQED